MQNTAPAMIGFEESQNLYVKDHFFYLAPIRGVTDAPFRTIFHHHFPYFDGAVAPFINPQRFANLKHKFLQDVLPEHNQQLPLVPQVLYNTSEDFINLGKKLEDMGYEHINWNLGCPAPQVANKKRGSGLLPHPDRIIKIVDDIHASLKAKISIKTRLGFSNSGDLEILLPQLETFPLIELIIHPRIGKQLYKGEVDLNGFARCLEMTSHQVVYNGDIKTTDDFTERATMFPQVKRWMLGRGALADPFLVAKIKGVTLSEDDRSRKLRDFHDAIYDDLCHRLSGPSHLLNRMKQIWAYLIESFPGNHKVLKKIRKSRTIEQYCQAVKILL